jgi:hypothetical protein
VCRRPIVVLIAALACLLGLPQLSATSATTADDLATRAYDVTAVAHDEFRAYTASEAGFALAWAQQVASASPSTVARVRPTTLSSRSNATNNGGQLQLFDTKPYDLVPESAPKALGRGSTGPTSPTSLNEQLAMNQVRSAPGGQPLPITMTDPRWPAADGWVKMQQKVNGVNIHYVRNGSLVDDFKFKYPEAPRQPGGTQLEIDFG